MATCCAVETIRDGTKIPQTNTSNAGIDIATSMKRDTSCTDSARRVRGLPRNTTPYKRTKHPNAKALAKPERMKAKAATSLTYVPASDCAKMAKQ